MVAKTLLFLTAVLGLLGQSTVCAQSNSLLHNARVPTQRFRCAQVSLIQTPEPIPFRVHDLISINVSERTLQQANALVNRRKDRGYDLEFANLILLLSGFRLRADKTIQNEKPGIDISALNQLRSLVQSNRTDILEFRIQAEVAEVKPNGNLVIEAHGTIGINNEISTYTLTGVISPTDVNPRTRTIESEYVANKRVFLEQIGPTRDSIKRGLFGRFVDMFAIF